MDFRLFDKERARKGEVKDREEENRE